MQKREIGRSGLRVAPLVFGGNVFGWTADEAASFSILDAFVDAGLDFIDTADVYSAWVPGHRGGESETLIGKWLKRGGRRDKVVLATKVGKLGARSGLKAANVAAALDDSLRRLQTDHVDVYFSHYDDPDTPLAETLGAYQRLIEAGKVRVIGASNYSGARLREALEVSRAQGLPAYQLLQPEYNLVERAGYESDLEPVVREAGIGVVPYYALASGFLSGKYRMREDLAGRARGSRVEKYLNPHGLGILDALDEVAGRHRTKPAAVALAWLMARPGITGPIASATSVDQLHELAAALELQLEAADLRRLDDASA